MNTVIKFRIPGKAGIIYQPSDSQPSITIHHDMALRHFGDEGEGLYESTAPAKILSKKSRAT
jgi:hypothetical protein